MKKLKTKQQLLADFKKANKTRRAVLANRAGFDSPEEYKEHLIAQVEKEKQTETVKEETLLTIHNVHLLDASYSMLGNKFDNAKLGINKEVEELKKHTSINYLQTLVSFSSRGSYKVESGREELKDFKFPHKIYHGNTALYQAIVLLLSDLLKNTNSDEKVLVKIFTDGQDNDSYRHEIDEAKLLIDRAKEKGITVTFVGTDYDVKRIVREIKIDESNTLVHNNTAKAVLDSFATTATATKTYAARAMAGEDVLTGFYKQQETL